MYEEITQCRMCGCSDLSPILDLGVQYLTGVFPSNPDAEISKGPLQLVLCSRCALLQLRQSFALAELYGDNYGYQSGLNSSMIRHLQTKAAQLEAVAKPSVGDVVLDIGSNDATFLRAYKDVGQALGGIDPSAGKFREFYPEGIGLVEDFFSLDACRGLLGEAKAKLITSIAMFYDLEDPMEFVRTVAEVLADDGIWHLEQSYMPSMLRACAYDTICHEHLEYYSLSQIKWMTDRTGLEIIDVELNDVNGGSFAVTVAKQGSHHTVNEEAVQSLLDEEQTAEIHDPHAFAGFCDAVHRHKAELPAVIRQLREDGKEVLGYGASTKGNVVLQYCGVTADDLPCIAEVNPQKYGCFTPGTKIPIVSEEEARTRDPDYFLVLPWHFRSSVLDRECEFLEDGGKLIFPLPEIEICTVAHENTPTRPSQFE